MDILRKARSLEARIARTLDGAVEGLVGPSARQPIEIVHAVLDAAEAQVQPAGRGRRVFPFDRMVVHVAAVSRTDRARFAALAEGPPALRERVIERLKTAGCDVARLTLDVAYATRPKAHWTTPEYHVEFERAGAPQEAPVEVRRHEPLRLDVAVLTGSAERKAYTFSGGRIDIGRRTEVVDHSHGLLRTNHIAFDEGGPDVNQSVSRRHAHIVYNATASEYRLHDDRSARGTALLRKGHTVRVPAGARGVRLESGDEIMIGQARLRVRIHSA
jgi:hypothetical protein